MKSMEEAEKIVLSAEKLTGTTWANTRNKNVVDAEILCPDRIRTAKEATPSPTVETPQRRKVFVNRVRLPVLFLSFDGVKVQT